MCPMRITEACCTHTAAAIAVTTAIAVVLLLLSKRAYGKVPGSAYLQPCLTEGGGIMGGGGGAGG